MEPREPENEVPERRESDASAPERPGHAQGPPGWRSILPAPSTAPPGPHPPRPHPPPPPPPPPLPRSPPHRVPAAPAEGEGGPATAPAGRSLPAPARRGSPPALPRCDRTVDDSLDPRPTTMTTSLQDGQRATGRATAQDSPLAVQVCRVAQGRGDAQDQARVPRTLSPASDETRRGAADRRKKKDLDVLEMPSIPNPFPELCCSPLTSVLSAGLFPRANSRKKQSDLHKLDCEVQATKRRYVMTM
nr:neural Wiskott-Aldrich syndrome protein-like [Meriones unguiculatus]XP_021482069.1 neural Wiskott-Aldrich syndrome protein-like [Meriones unguiculatus]